MCSVFSLTLQSSIIQFCKESKMLKNFQNTITEEEEETKDSDKSPDEEALYIAHQQFYFSMQNCLTVIPNNSTLNFASCYFKIPSPPPKF